MPTPPTSTGPLKPNGWWYGVAGLLGVAGIVAMILLIVGAIQNLADKVAGFERVDASESGTVTLDGTGGYTIYHEYDGASDNFGFPSRLLTITMRDPDGDDVLLERYIADVTYSTDDYEGVAVYSFDADQAGEYTISSDSGEGTIAVGRGVGSDLVKGILLAILAGIVGVLAGAILAVVVGVRRGQDRRRRFVRSTPNYWPGQPGPPGGGWGSPPQYPPTYPPQQPGPPPGAPPTQYPGAF
jgi:hypothetical protein